MIIDTLTPRIERLDDGSDPRYGKFLIEPLERGYGTTLGSSLRRVLISSIPGAAVTFVTMEGVLHERLRAGSRSPDRRDPRSRRCGGRA